MKKFLEYLNSPQRPILVFDGATGTSLQDLNLSSDDFGGSHLEGCNENLVLSSPASVKQVHESFLEVGCDIIETNTFGATSIVLAEYGIEDKAYKINLRAAELAREVAAKYSTNNKPRFVAGSIGPTTKLPTLGHIDFDILKQSYYEQVTALIKGKVDLFIVETCQDVLQIKAALQAIEKAKCEYKVDIPIMVSVTMETTGRMLVGTDINTVITILEPFKIDILGLNCATGPEQMKEHINYLSENSPFHISCIPNAGLPENIGGVAHYRLTPIELKIHLMSFICDLGVQIVGGCCGTTPSHIKELCLLTEELKNIDNLFKKKKVIEPSASSVYDTTPYKQDNSFLIVGERLNASGSKKVRDLLNNNDWDGLIGIARNQQKENAHILDVNVDYVGRDGVSDMKEVVKRLVTNVNLPLMLDSTDHEKMESGLKQCGGKSILNSTNYEDGNERFFKVLSLAKKFGAAVVIGTIDEEGMARTSLKKFSIAKRAYKDVQEYGIPSHEIFYDPLALPISTGIEEDRKNALETINSIKTIKKHLPNVHIILGISNISFGLNPSARITLNSVFLSEAIKAGMDSAIVSPSKILPLSKITPENIKICIDLIYDNREFEKDICIYDPLSKLTEEFAGITTKTVDQTIEIYKQLSIEERLSKHIIDGEKLSLEDNLNIALKTYKPLEIINSFLLNGMKVVGELFGSGQMQLPFVLQSAETMKFAVSFLEPFMDKKEGEISSKGTFLIATVKGDVHDIGKNLVDIILTNNGYNVINLGIKQEITTIIEAQKKYKADCIAMSGLLVKSTAFMKDNLQALNKEGITVPVVLGGAALTPKFVNKDCGDVYKGKVIYGKDAFTDLKFMDEYMKAKNENLWSDTEGFLESIPDGLSSYISTTRSSEKIEINNKKSTTNINKESKNIYQKENTERSSYVDMEIPIKPPFTGTKIMDLNDINLLDVIEFLDRKALFAGQWQMKRSRTQSKDQYLEFLNEKAEPILTDWIDRIINENLVAPSVVYGYFPCGRNNNELQVYCPKTKKLLGNFLFPRQKSGNRFCLADFFHDLVSNKPIDFLPMQAVTMGDVASVFSQKLFDSNAYTDYLFFHGLSVQLAEALAEYVHSIIRKECGFKSFEPNNIKEILEQKYRGCRFSFGYPACPSVIDSLKQLNWLEAERIGLSMDESEQMHPEQSTTAIVSLHSKARYFSC